MSRRGASVRTWFLVDAAVTGVNALAYLGLRTLLPDVVGVPAGLYPAVGAFLLVVAVALLAVAQAETDLAALGAVLTIVNVAWAAISIVVVPANPLRLTTLGLVWVVLQAAAVLAFGLLQLRALRAVPARAGAPA